MHTRSFLRRSALTGALLLSISFGASIPSHAAVWQWSIPVKGGTDKAGPSRAFLWIPVNCKKLRGVVFCQNNMEEEMILENPKFRQALAKLDYGEVWAAPAFSLFFRFDQGAGGVFNSMMSDLADESGYRELNFVPVIPMGHSAAASMPYYFAVWAPDRTVACLSVSGQWPYFRNPNFAPDIWGTRTIDYIPSLETMGEFESADTWANEGVYERQQHPLMPLSMAAGPAQSHFIAADSKVDYLILYIRKAVQYRVPKTWTVDGPAHLIPIDPTKTGWLTDRWRKDSPPTSPAAPVGEYKGDPKQAFWYFDREMATETETYEAAYGGDKRELVGFVQDGQMVPQTNTHLQETLKFEPEADGITFKLATAFYNTVLDGSPRLTGWAQLPVGSAIGHASGGGPITIERIVGPFAQISPDTFVVQFQKETIGNEKNFELVFAATHPGDAEYRPAVQQAHMYIPAQNTQGADQHITFPVVANQMAGTKTVKLMAASDAGVTVSYYVREGPAELAGNTLTITPIPPGAQYPVKVTVVAWQYGIAPSLKTAAPVGCTFYITKPGIAAPPAGLIDLQAALGVSTTASK